MADPAPEPVKEKKPKKKAPDAAPEVAAPEVVTPEVPAPVARTKANMAAGRCRKSRF